MKNSSFVYVIPFSDFERICSTIYTIVQSEGDDLRQSCVFVNIAGAMILNEHYKIKAKVCAGAALYRLSETRNLEFRDKNDEFVVGSQEGFHCWIDTGEWFIDFTSPMYPEMLKLAGSTESCGKKMFQKTHEQMSESPNDVLKEGDFYFYPNGVFTRQLMDSFFASSDNIDLLKLVCQYYTKPPKRMSNGIFALGENNQYQDVNLFDVSLVGCW
jgi:hypothetical protein